MLGRLIDQLMPTHVNCPSEAAIVSRAKQRSPTLRAYGPSSPWGSALPLLQEADLNLINLETSVTTHPTPWPDKAFNYRMHPTNIEALKIARIDYASLANNHMLDFKLDGLRETVKTVREAGIQFAGAGENATAVTKPAFLELPRASARTEHGLKHKIEVHAFSDHPSEWRGIDNFNLLDYSAAWKQRLQSILMPKRERDQEPSLKICSVHWGPNYSWKPSDSIQSLAHFLIDECKVDVVYGHSSHHVQGVEKYRGSLILYGCGDFVDDYAPVASHRNDLGALWRVNVGEAAKSADRRSLKLETLEVFPTRINNFQVEALDVGDPDHEWVVDKVKTLSTENHHFEANASLGECGQIMFDI